MEKSRLVRLKAMSSAVNKEHGYLAVSGAGRMRNVKRISTGSLSFDFALGGGIPVGHTTILAGEYSSGKTTSGYRIMGIAQGLCANCLRVVRNLEVVQTKEEKIDPGSGEVLQEAEWVAVGTCDCFNQKLFNPRKYPDEKKDGFEERIEVYRENSFEEFRVVLVDVENALDVTWAKAVGLDCRRLVRSCPDTAEQAIDIYDYILRSGGVDMIVLDSIAAMTPAIEIEESMEKQQRAMQARLVNKFVRKAQAAANAVAFEYGRPPTQIWMNQLRVDINATFGDNKIMPGGMGQRFGSSVIARMWASKWGKPHEFGESSNKENVITTRDSVRINVSIEKNRTATAKITGGYRMAVSGPDKGKVDELDFVIDQAMRFGEIEKFKAKWKIGDKSFNTKTAMIEELSKPAVFERLKKLLLIRMLGEM